MKSSSVSPSTSSRPTKAAKRPKNFDLGAIKVKVIRGPHKDASDRWYWQAVKYEDGAAETVWTGWGTVAEVQAALAPILTGEAPKSTKTDEKVTTVKDLLEVWLAWQLDREISQGRKDASKNYARHLAKVIGDVLLSRYSTATLETYQKEALKTRATGSVKNEIALMGEAWTWGGERGHAPEKRVKSPRLKYVHVRSRYVPDAVEFWKVLDAVATVRPWARLALLIIGAIGSRKGEIQDLTWNDVYQAKSRIRLAGKTGERLAEVPANVMAELAAARPKDPNLQGERIFPVATKTFRTEILHVLRTACATVGVPYFPPSKLRTMVENLLFDAGADPGVVSAQLGHSAKVSLEHYRQVKASRVVDVMTLAGLGQRPSSNVVSLAERRRAAES